jgi:hypothetical protein
LWRAVEVDRQGGIAQPDDGQVSKDARHLCRHRERRVGADEVENDFGALTARHVLDPFDRIVA